MNTIAAYLRELGLDVVSNGRTLLSSAAKETPVAVVEEDPMSKEVANRNAAAISSMFKGIQGARAGG